MHTLTTTEDCLPCLQLAAACLELEDGYRPPITFVVVQKRHHTRLYAEDPMVMDAKSGNVAPGEMLVLQLDFMVAAEALVCLSPMLAGSYALQLPIVREAWGLIQAGILKGPFGACHAPSNTPLT